MLARKKGTAYELKANKPTKQHLSTLVERAATLASVVPTPPPPQHPLCGSAHDGAFKNSESCPGFQTPLGDTHSLPLEGFQIAGKILNS